jgi:hypothetical protein
VVKVLVGQKRGDRFPGFWAEFEGEEISSNKDTRGEKHIIYTLYRCTTYQREATASSSQTRAIPPTPSTSCCPSPKIHTSRVQAPTIQSHGIRIR